VEIEGFTIKCAGLRIQVCGITIEMLRSRVLTHQDGVIIELFEDSGLKIRIEASIFHLAPVRIWQTQPQYSGTQKGELG
jgi:hypothetical protein